MFASSTKPDPARNRRWSNDCIKTFPRAPARSLGSFQVETAPTLVRHRRYCLRRCISAVCYGPAPTRTSPLPDRARRTVSPQRFSGVNPVLRLAGRDMCVVRLRTARGFPDGVSIASLVRYRYFGTRFNLSESAAPFAQPLPLPRPLLCRSVPISRQIPDHRDFRRRDEATPQDTGLTQLGQLHRVGPWAGRILRLLSAQLRP